MYIFLIIWFIFLFAYIIFNVYGLYRVMAMRFKGDVVPLVVLLYVIVMFVIISVSVMLISSQNWGQNISELIRF